MTPQGKEALQELRRKDRFTRIERLDYVLSIGAPDDFYTELTAHAKRFDLLGMAGQKVLAIDPKMVDPDLRAVASVANSVGAVAYNKNRLAAELVPNSLGDFLKPEFKGTNGSR